MTQPQYIRESILAGTWYPESETALSGMIRHFLSRAENPPVDQQILGLIAPHAGYIYSGQTAAYAYQTLQGKQINTVAVLAPLHRMPLGMYVTTQASYYRTPLGKVPVAQDLIQEINQSIPLKQVAHDNEHAVEIQLPFLQSVLKEFRLLPMMIGHGDVFAVGEMVQALTTLAQKEKILFIASSDMHHIPDYGQVLERDFHIREKLETYNLESIRELLNDPDCTVCGRVAISIVLEVCRNLGARRCRILHQTNSGDVTGNREEGEYTVGYLAAALTV